MPSSYDHYLQNIESKIFDDVDDVEVMRYIKNSGLPPEDQKRLQLKLTGFRAEYLIICQSRDQFIQNILMGIVIALIGTALSIFASSGKTETVVYIGLIFAGIYIAYQGYKNYRIPIQDLRMKDRKIKRAGKFTKY